MNLLLFLAQEGLPDWAKLVLGPLGALVVMGVYAWHTERTRIPELRAEARARDQALAQARKECAAEKQALMDVADREEAALEAELRAIRGKLTKERALRAWWQRGAQDMATRAGEELPPIPTDIDSTFYGGE